MLDRWPDYPERFFNQAGSGPAAPAVRAQVRVVDDVIARLGAHSPRGLAHMDETLADARQTVARSLDLPGDWTVSFASSATDALNLVAAGLPPVRGRIIVSEVEHPSGLLAMHLQQRRGFVVSLLAGEPADTWAERATLARASADLLLVSHVAYRTGAEAPLPDLGARIAGGLLAVDVSQSLGQVPLDPVWGVADLAVGLGHKWLHGPYPSGLLLLGPRARERLRVPRGGWHAREHSSGFEAAWRTGGERFEPGSPDTARIAALACAFDHLPSFLAPRSRRLVAEYRAQVEAVLRECGLKPLAAGAPTGIVVAPLPRAARGVVADLLARGYTAKDLNPPECPDLLRISLTPLHTPAEVDGLSDALAAVLAPGAA